MFYISDAQNYLIKIGDKLNLLLNVGDVIIIIYFIKIIMMRIYIMVALLLTGFGSLAQNLQMYVGTYTGTGSKGIYVYKFDAATGKSEFLNSTDSSSNPSFLTISNDQ
ncbi:MAG: beta-propeller fold lactonase family protein, partial [Ginsengibacter sp.]